MEILPNGTKVTWNGVNGKLKGEVIGYYMGNYVVKTGKGVVLVDSKSIQEDATI